MVTTSAILPELRLKTIHLVWTVIGKQASFIQYKKMSSLFRPSVQTLKLWTLWKCVEAEKKGAKGGERRRENAQRQKKRKRNTSRASHGQCLVTIPVARRCVLDTFWPAEVFVEQNQEETLVFCSLVSLSLFSLFLVRLSQMSRFVPLPPPSCSDLCSLVGARGEEVRNQKNRRTTGTVSSHVFSPVF